jgi:hypothetical protein
MPPTVAQMAPAFADAAAESCCGFAPSSNATSRADYDDRRILLPPLPPEAQDFFADLFAYKTFDARAVFQQLDDEWTRRILVPTAPLVLEDWAWCLPAQAAKDFSLLCSKPADGEPIDFARPIVTPLAYDEDTETSHDFSEKRFWLESDVLLGVPFPPSTAWLDDPAGFFVGSSCSLAAMVALEEFVNAPAGGNLSGPAPPGRSVRLGLAFSSFR